MTTNEGDLLKTKLHLRIMFALFGIIIASTYVYVFS